jgi:hypothetical protein
MRQKFAKQSNEQSFFTESFKLKKVNNTANPFDKLSQNDI